MHQMQLVPEMIGVLRHFPNPYSARSPTTGP